MPDFSFLISYLTANLDDINSTRTEDGDKPFDIRDIIALEKAIAPTTPQRLEAKDSGNQVQRSLYLVTDGPGLGIQFPGFRTKASPESDPVVRIEFREGIPYALVWSDRTQEDPTHVISLEKAAYGVRCPLEPRNHEIPGCGSFNTGDPDEEGLWDCECGIWFNAEEADFSACSTDDE